MPRSWRQGACPWQWWTDSPPCHPPSQPAWVALPSFSPHTYRPDLSLPENSRQRSGQRARPLGPPSERPRRLSCSHKPQASPPKTKRKRLTTPPALSCTPPPHGHAYRSFFCFAGSILAASAIRPHLHKARCLRIRPHRRDRRLRSDSCRRLPQAHIVHRQLPLLPRHLPQLALNTHPPCPVLAPRERSTSPLPRGTRMKREGRHVGQGPAISRLRPRQNSVRDANDKLTHLMAKSPCPRWFTRTAVNALLHVAYHRESTSGTCFRLNEPSREKRD